MAAITEPRPGEGRFDTLIRLLGLEDPQTRQEAAAMFCQVGKPAVKALIQEACKRGRQSQHRIAILSVVEQIGGPLDFKEMFSLQSLLGHRDPDVREKAVEAIMSLSPGGVPKNAEDAASMFAFNPFLQPPLNRQVLRGDPDLARWRAEFNAERRRERYREYGRQ